MAATWFAGDDGATTGGMATSLSTGTAVPSLAGLSDVFVIGTLRILTASSNPAITCNAQDLTLLGSVVNVAGSNYTEYTFYRDDPTAGAFTATWTGSSHAWLSYQVASGVTGIRGDALVTAAGQAASTSQTLNVTTVAGDLVLSCLVSSGNITATGNGLTSEYVPTANNSTRMYCGYATADDTSYPAGWTLSGTGEYFEHSALALIPAVTTSAAITGTLATAPIYRSDIVAGGKTIIATLTGDTYVASFASIQDDLTDGCDAGNATANGWNETIRDAVVNPITWVRTSATVATGTLAAVPSYAPSATQTITVTLPASALTLATPIVATPTITTLVGPLLSAYSGTTNASGQVVITLTSDDPLTANGEILAITAVAAGVTSRTSARPSTP